MAKLVVIFPGIGYHHDKPLLYYSRQVAKKKGYEEILNLKYSYDGGNIRGNKEKMEEAYRALYLKAAESLSDVVWEEFDDILFISKSVGTIIATSYAENHNLKNVKHVLYTPLEYTYQYKIDCGIAFIGTSDPWSDVDEVIRLSEAKGVSMTVFDALNHSLECDDVDVNLRVLTGVMEKICEFLD